MFIWKVMKYFPQTNSEWSEAVISVASFSNFDNLLVKFYFNSGGGNNLYIDDIDIQGSIGTSQEPVNSSIDIFPNPVTDQLFIEGIYERLEIYNIFGELILSGDAKTKLDLSNINNGIYLINIYSGDRSLTKKVTITR